MTNDTIAAPSAAEEGARADISRRVHARRLFLAFHRWTGLILGAIFVVVGLTGAILSFAPQIDAALDPQLLRSTPPSADAPYAPLDEIYAAAVADLPRGATPSFMAMPRGRDGVVSLSYRLRDADDVTETHRLFVDPYTTKVTGDRLIKKGDDEIRQFFFNSVRSLHYTLWQGSDRSWLVGGPALVLLPSMILGIALWWPRPGQWRLAFAIKRKASAERRIYDLHRVVGALVAVLLCCSLTTGSFFVFRQQGRDLIRLFSSVRETPRGLASRPIADRDPIGLDAALRIAERSFPGAEPTGISLPANEKGVYVVSMRAPSEPNHANGRNRVTVDRFSGQILFTEDRSAFSAGERFLEWLLPLHSGEAFGLAGHAVIFLAGLAPGFLYVTGFIRWRRQRRRRAVSA